MVYNDWQIISFMMKSVILSWLQNDGSRRFSIDQLRKKQLLPTFQPDVLVVFSALSPEYD